MVETNFTVTKFNQGNVGGNVCGKHPQKDVYLTFFYSYDHNEEIITQVATTSSIWALKYAGWGRFVPNPKPTTKPHHLPV
jgi:hypothetical protein